MAKGFPGFPPEALRFLKGLKRNNNRDWFQARKPVYQEKLKAPLGDLVEAINAELARFAPRHVTEPKSAVYRIYRDTRFSNDKTPYKTHAAANFPRRGLEKHASAGFYFHVSPEEVIAAAGCYMPGSAELLAIRTHLAEHHEAFAKLLAGKKLRRIAGELQGQTLTRPPKGFAKEHPAIDLLRHKQWYFYTQWEPDLTESPELFKRLVEYFQTTAPVVEFLNEPLGKRKQDPLTVAAVARR